jgi:hypothetical protein
VAGEPRDRIGRDEWPGQDEFVAPGEYRVTLTAGRSAPRVRVVGVRAVPGVYKTEL